MEESEAKILDQIERSVAGSRADLCLDEIGERLERVLMEKPGEIMTWETLAVDRFNPALPREIRSAWVFVLRAGVTTGAERHPNSHQRSMSLRGSGEVQNRSAEEWETATVTSDPAAELEERWASVPINVWHQWVVGEGNWTLLSFHTVPKDELIEERPNSEGEEDFAQMRYSDREF